MELRLSKISSLQIFQLIRFSSFLLIGIVFTKTALSQTEIGEYETVLFIAGAVSFFWLNGLIQGLLSLFREPTGRSKQMFNAFVLISGFTILCIGFLVLFEHSFSTVLLKRSGIPFFKYLLWFLLFSVPANLVQYIYLLQNKSKSIVVYGVLSFSIMLILVCLPITLGYSIEVSLGGLVLAAFFRFIWLIFLLARYSKAQLSISYLSEHLKLSLPLILSAFLSGSAQYIDGFIVSSHLNEAAFAVFRYGAREFPLVLLLANAFSTAMIPEFSAKENLEKALVQIKNYSRKLIHFLFPVSIILLLSTHFFFPIIFNVDFSESATIFNIYLLLIVSRLVFPQTIFIGLKQTKIIAIASFFEIILNVTLSIWFIHLWGLAGIAFATFIAYLFEKIFLVVSLKTKKGILPVQYMNISLHVSYSLLLLFVFYLVEFVIYQNGFIN